MILIHDKSEVAAQILLPGSKSISNRLLILNELLNLNLKLLNLSSAQDTRTLINALQLIKTSSGNNTISTINIGHAGTDMRFLAALLSIKNGMWSLTGSEIMKQRPIGELVLALRQIGAEIHFEEKEGYPPLAINGRVLEGGKIEIDASISSQFISALLLISPVLKKGLEIHVKNKAVSSSYVQMTISILEAFGIEVLHVNNNYSVKPPDQRTMHDFVDKEFHIESDWSSASYWYSIAALCKMGTISLKGLQHNSLQGDSVLPDIYSHLGVNTEFVEDGILLTKSPIRSKFFEYDFENCPDLAQTLAVTCLGLGINCRLSGLGTLQYKETQRLSALKTEMEKFGVSVNIIENQILDISNMEKADFKLRKEIATYEDHRMAMSFAPLAIVMEEILIENPQVVEKSYPEFWTHLKAAGFLMK